MEQPVKDESPEPRSQVAANAMTTASTQEDAATEQAKTSQPEPQSAVKGNNEAQGTTVSTEVATAVAGKSEGVAPDAFPEPVSANVVSVVPSTTEEHAAESVANLTASYKLKPTFDHSANMLLESMHSMNHHMGKEQSAAHQQASYTSPAPKAAKIGASSIVTLTTTAPTLDATSMASTDVTVHTAPTVKEVAAKAVRAAKDAATTCASDTLSHEALGRDAVQPLLQNDKHNIFTQLRLLGCVVLELVYCADQRFCHLLSGSDEFYHLVGFKNGQAEAQNGYYDKPRKFVHPDDLPLLTRYFQQIEHGAKSLDIDFRLLHRRGYYIDVHARAALLGHNEQDLPVFAMLLGDVTAQNRQRSALELDQRRHALLNNGYQDMVFEYDANTDSMERLGNYPSLSNPPAPKISTNFLADEVRMGLIHPDDVPTIEKLLTDRSLVDRNIPTVVKFRLKDEHSDRFCWHTCSAIAYIDESTGHLKVVGKFINIDQYETRLRTLQNQSKLDVLTELYNLNTMYRHCKSLLGLDGDESHALLVFDLNNFQSVNDTYGRAFGDSILRVVASVLRLTFRHSDYLCRLGGDEFGIMLRNVSRVQAYALAQNFIQNLARKRETMAHDFNITGCIGVAMYPEDAPDCGSLLKAAYEALGAARKMKGEERIALYHAPSEQVSANIEAAAERLKLIESASQAADNAALQCLSEARQNLQLLEQGEAS